MKNIINLIVSLVLVSVITGCGTRSMVVLIPDPDGNVGQLVVANEGGQQILKEANQSVTVSDQKASPGEIKKLSVEEIRSTFSGALDAQPLTPLKFILYFVQNSNELTDESKALLPQIVETIHKRDSNDIVISGHTDTAGSEEYNYRLSLDRAKEVQSMLVACGLSPDSITVTSHGEGNPLVKTGDGVPEPKNRRVEVVIK